MKKLNTSPSNKERLIDWLPSEPNSEVVQENNLEYDLRSCEWICNKAKADITYAVNVYRALCNNVFQRTDIWPILKDATWSCSWRYAGGVVADMVENGDYLDFYCAGYEGTITDEFADDLKKIGWIVLQKSDIG